MRRKIAPKAKRKKTRKPRSLFSWAIVLPNRGWSYYSSWFVLLLLVAFIFAFVWRNILGSVALLAMGVFYLWVNLRAPSAYKVKITKEGVVYNNRLYKFKDLLSYSIRESAQGYVLVVKTAFRLLPEVVFMLPDDKTEKVDQLLAKYLPKEKRSLGYKLDLFTS